MNFLRASGDLLNDKVNLHDILYSFSGILKNVYGFFWFFIPNDANICAKIGAHRG